MLKICEKPKKKPKTDDGSSRSTTEASPEKNILVVGYSPTGGGHTGRTLDIVRHAIEHGTIDKNYLVILYVPPLWDKKERPEILKTLIEKLLDKSIKVKVIESEKPVYGYLNPETGGSDDAKILERIALQPLRNKLNNIFYDEELTYEEKIKLLQKNNFLVKYFGEPIKLTKKISEIEYEEKNKYKGKKIDNLQRMQANTLMTELVNDYGKDNIKILSDMDPALQKAARNNNINPSNRLDQQNHAILLDLKDPHDKNNLNMKNAVLAKVLGGRGEKISHISLGGKNTLKEAHTTLEKLYKENNPLMEGIREDIYKKIFNEANKNKLDNNKPENNIDNFSGVIKGKEVTDHEKIDSVIYIYAHKKTNKILGIIKDRIDNEHDGYNDKVFIFCGNNAIPGYNAMHLAYLIDAHGITTSGAGTSGEFVYLHKNAGAESNLLSLPIEGHNEQEKITCVLHEDEITKKHMFPKDINIKDLEKNIDELVKESRHDKKDDSKFYTKMLKALSNEETYVKQAHDILFGEEELSEESLKQQEIQQKMYENENLKGTRKYLNLVFQLLNFLTENKNPFPINIEFAEGKHKAGLKLINIHETIKTFQYDWLMKKKLGLLKEDDVKDLPLITEVRTLIGSKNYTNKDEHEKLKKRFGDHMTTGF
ncbi:hypothetical protein [Yersinia pekkanenii]|uniref:Uncharacterized protein n=1 Tax=Yersinia pekkanenii TaxID=1288385 RepID=A0A0T9PM41_9GAMM|nr:hypothetical protein [Yersinia pekkanenii]CNH72552.1 Uncharacterised protein [Yersinia pekkanenii]CRY68071.1 Uncharacterised protein [Yersinia pekkanenii]